ncbi:hypothetical protein V6N12_046668 [Hibiscus sabdariffa]|uniref:Endonuclease/exonuclease/phosphatase domain-containing protein n=1 Tax=Hibiscus sabdariffa TaxID=183260 RepID=A0ABR2AQC7_9ROSI
MSASLTVMTFNLHEDQPEDSPNSWEKRRDLCISVITSYSPIILCTQQGVKSQLDYLQQGLPGNVVQQSSFNLRKNLNRKDKMLPLGQFLINVDDEKDALSSDICFST